MPVEVMNSSGRQLDIDYFQRVSHRLLRLVGLGDKQLNVVFINMPGIEGLNRKWFSRPWPTNVISFPMDEPEILGDIVVCIDRAIGEASEGLTSPRNRITELIIHGLVHLMGEDHELGGVHEARMKEKEQQLRHALIREDIMADLCINVDHIATIRQARGGNEPDPVLAAGLVELAGADGIVVHLREDRRHIQDRDVRLLREVVKTRLTLEMAATEEMLQIASEIRPDIVTLVPEKRQELTTEGGLDVKGLEESVRQAVDRLHQAGIPVSLFVDPEEDQIQASSRTGAECIEIHTGRYADALDNAEQEKEFDQIAKMAALAADLGLRVHAGHGLNYQNTGRLAALSDIVEFSIGHAVVARASLVGMERAVREMLAIVKGTG